MTRKRHRRNLKDPAAFLWLPAESHARLMDLKWDALGGLVLVHHERTLSERTTGKYRYVWLFESGDGAIEVLVDWSPSKNKYGVTLWADPNEPTIHLARLIADRLIDIGAQAPQEPFQRFVEQRKRRRKGKSGT